VEELVVVLGVLEVVEVEVEVEVEAVLVPTGLGYYFDLLVQKLTAAIYSFALALLLLGLLVVGFV
jgi:hypothetical protein